MVRSQRESGSGAPSGVDLAGEESTGGSGVPLHARGPSERAKSARLTGQALQADLRAAPSMRSVAEVGGPYVTSGARMGGGAPRSGSAIGDRAGATRAGWPRSLLDSRGTDLDHREGRG